MEFIPNNNQQHILSFIRVKNDKIILAIFNFSETPYEVLINDDRLSGKFQNFNTKEEIEINKSLNLKLDKWGWNIFIKK
ncbi:MAG: alpha-glucosidase C-terminal domain-containing protein [Ignavibacterium sp.]